MNALDTNVLVYSVDDYEPAKQAKAIALLAQLGAVPQMTLLLGQAMAELIAQLRSWHNQGRITWATLVGYVTRIRGMFPLKEPTVNVLDAALDLAGRYSLSHWDSMILGACKDAGVTTLYTEDMGSPTNIDGIQLVNPF